MSGQSNHRKAAFQSYTAIGNREDLSDIIHNISPTETPFLSNAAKMKAATQIGTQIHAGDNYRRVVELVQSGAIGKIEEMRTPPPSETLRGSPARSPRLIRAPPCFPTLVGGVGAADRGECAP